MKQDKFQDQAMLRQQVKGRLSEEYFDLLIADHDLHELSGSFLKCRLQLFHAPVRSEAGIWTT